MFAKTVIASLLIVSSIAFGKETRQESYERLEINPARAKFNYQMLCQGCHIPTGEGGRGVPNMLNQVGYFLNIAQAREYLIRVPGSANSALNDERLAELLNWVILEFAQQSEPEQWPPFTQPEITAARAEPLFEVVQHRHKLVDQLNAAGFPVVQ